MTAPRKEPETTAAPCPEEIKDAADDLKSLRDQTVDPLTPPQKGAVKLIEQRLRDAVKQDG